MVTVELEKEPRLFYFVHNCCVIIVLKLMAAAEYKILIELNTNIVSNLDCPTQYENVLIISGFLSKFMSSLHDTLG